jgi:hypothetical protein
LRDRCRERGVRSEGRRVAHQPAYQAIGGWLRGSPPGPSPG